ncbi:MAG: hypothetical protein M3Y87_06340 [Myxococcota bacterium]|nr:hypothetical protein [Myxococcota bacterium]
MAPPSTSRIKGAAVREFLRWYTERFSRSALEEAVASLPDALQLLFDADADAIGVLPSSWYDSAAVHALIDAIFARIAPEERDASIRDGARFAVAHSARGIYRFVLERLTPEMYCRNIQRLWNMLHDTGSREIVTISPTHVRSVIRDWPGHHPVLCVAVTETMGAVFEIMGARGVEVRRLGCVDEGDAECTAELRWRA